MAEIYVCAQCSYRADLKFQFDHHFLTKHGRIATVSDIHCSDFPTFYMLKLYEHYGTAHFDLYRCERCEYNTHSIVPFAKHAAACKAKKLGPERELLLIPAGSLESQTKSYNCSHCSYQANRPDSMRRHNLRHMPRESIEWFKCDHCPYETNQKRYLKSHAMKHMPDREILECPQCSFTTKLSNCLSAHMQLQHKPDDEVKWHGCPQPQCSYKTKYRKNLNRHALQHKGDDAVDWFPCPHCSYKSKMKDALKKHVVLNHAPAETIKWYECQFCEFKTKRERNLKEHSYKHLPDEAIDWFTCEQCSYKAKRKALLTRHLRIYHGHDPDRKTADWFACEQCSYRGKYEAQLKRHVLIKHTESQHGPDGIKWFNCDQCSYKTKTNYNLNRHKLTMHNDEAVPLYQNL